MPYVNKEKKSEYQKRTATPYMKKWREKNRDKLRSYMREWSKKRRLNKEVSKKDYEKRKTSTSFEVSRVRTNEYLRGEIISMSDNYITYCMTKRGVISKDIVNKELINIHRKFLIIKRQLKKYDNRSN